MCGTIFQLHQFITTIFPYLFDKLKMCARRLSSVLVVLRRRHRKTLAIAMLIKNANEFKCILYLCVRMILFVHICLYRVAAFTPTHQPAPFIGGVCVCSNFEGIALPYRRDHHRMASHVAYARCHELKHRCVVDTPDLCVSTSALLITTMNYCRLCVFILSANAPTIGAQPILIIFNGCTREHKGWSHTRASHTQSF